MSRREAEKKEPQNSMLYACIYGALLGVVISIVLCLVASLVIHNTDWDEGVMHVAGYLCSALGGLFGGIVATRKCEAKGLICGLCSGVMMAAILYLCGSVIGGAPTEFGRAALSVFLPLGTAVIGGVIGANLRR